MKTYKRKLPLYTFERFVPSSRGKLVNSFERLCNGFYGSAALTKSHRISLKNMQYPRKLLKPSCKYAKKLFK